LGVKSEEYAQLLKSSIPPSYPARVAGVAARVKRKKLKSQKGFQAGNKLRTKGKN
jgi:hypothetical protein